MKLLNNKSLQTFLAIGPLVLFILCFISYFAFFFSIFLNMEQLENQTEPPMQMFIGLGVFFVIFFLAMFLSLFSLIYFVLHAAKNPNLTDGNMRLVWILIIVFISGIGNIVYWFAEIKSKNPRPIIPD